MVPQTSLSKALLPETFCRGVIRCTMVPFQPNRRFRNWVKHKTVDYLKPGDIFGLNELYHNFSSANKIPFQFSLRAIGYLDVLRIPASALDQYVFPNLDKKIIEAIVAEMSPKITGFSAEGTRDESSEALLDKETGAMEFFVEERFINGSQTMLINLDRCTGCDDCVRACASTHDNNPRFVRHGKRHDQLMVSNACMHCHDPVCMIGCPTGAIHRTQSGEVVINDLTCIGCSTCANSCPYGNIRMVEIFDKKGARVVDDNGQPVIKATKCDLCVEEMVSPACEKACPHDALRRIDVHSIDKIEDWLE